MRASGIQLKILFDPQGSLTMLPPHFLLLDNTTLKSPATMLSFMGSLSVRLSLDCQQNDFYFYTAYKH